MAHAHEGKPKILMFAKRKRWKVQNERWKKRKEGKGGKDSKKGEYSRQIPTNAGNLPDKGCTMRILLPAGVVEMLQNWQMVHIRKSHNYFRELSGNVGGLSGRFTEGWANPAHARGK